MTYNIASTNYWTIPGMLKGTTFIKNLLADHIIRIVGEQLYVSRTEMFSIHRYKRIVQARQIAMYLIRKNTTRSWTDISNLFGGRDHTTAIHSYRTVENLCFSDEQYKQRLLQIENLL